MRLGDQLGRVAVGQLADLLLIDLDTLAFTPLNDLTRCLSIAKMAVRSVSP